MCEAFTGQTPLSHVVDERIPASQGRYSLSSRPIESLVAVNVVSADGSQSPLGDEHYSIDFAAAGQACIDLHIGSDGQAISVQLRVGIASNWPNIPPALKQGLIRLAAFHYRDRDRSGGAKASIAPPASITALWRPWRTMRLQ